MARNCACYEKKILESWGCLVLIRKTFRWEGSHILPLHPGKCARLHGHSWVLHVMVEGDVDETTGMVMDYADISDRVKPLIEDLDHRHLGAWEVEKGLVVYHIQGDRVWGVPWLPMDWNPTSENLLLQIGMRLSETFITWSRLALEETCTAYAEVTAKEVLEYERQQSYLGRRQRPTAPRWDQLQSGRRNW